MIPPTKTILVMLTFFAGVFTIQQAQGHGTLSSPKSRVLRVYEDMTGGGANHPATDAAIGHAGGGA